ncbi:DUF11 domain-containing protein [Oceanithermus profundus]|uniref:DUF11 domain-containing protein n=1 Tax=Oceanithermus profundus (strain DSM 14977 / NBRC 100410 / VKM B-2274 / 506) TaxID=670487 RepID=E4UA72_OCEP5|nr:DUF11 domain-containing protein [Oceanithermus profundus]ADR37515.1 hypothetical protein Ocepr_2065 [Oceanithermus profundus DSM 14977]
MNLRRAVWTAVFFALAVAAVPPLWLELASFRVLQVTNAEGERLEVFERAASAAPGETLEWRLAATNRSDRALEDVVLVIPVPPGTRYLAGSAEPLDLGGVAVRPEFSFDGGARYARPPLYRKVVVVTDGVEQEREVEVKPEAYTHVRWVLPALDAGQTVTVRLRTVVR